MITPLVAVGLLGAASFDPYKLLMTLMMLIVLPLIVSRLLLRKGIKEQVTPYRGAITKRRHLACQGDISKMFPRFLDN